MQRDLPSATSMVSFPQSGNQLFTRRWMPWYALAWKPRSLAQYPWTADGTAAPRKLAGLCHFPTLAVQHAPTRITPVWRDHKIRREAGGKIRAMASGARPMAMQITRPLPRSLVRCLPDRGLWSPSPSCDALALRHPGREERTERHSAASSYATWRLSGFGVALVWQCEELRLGTWSRRSLPWPGDW
jgi:hypothetical protein